MQEPLLEFILSPAGREQDAWTAAQAAAARHGLAGLEGDPPRLRLRTSTGLAQALDAGQLPDPLRLLCVDLAYAEAVRRFAVGWRMAPGPGNASAPPASLEIGDFLAAARQQGLRAGCWYRVHAPAGHRCRPTGFA